MSPLEIGIFAIVGLLVLIYLGMPIGVSMLFVSFLGVAGIRGDTVALRMIGAVANDSLREEVQNAMVEAGKYYTQSHGQDLLERHEAVLNKMVEVGASQDPPVTITPMSQEDREAWVKAMPNIAKEWADDLEARGVPARQFLKAYLDGVRERGEKPVRNWDEEL